MEFTGLIQRLKKYGGIIHKAVITLSIIEALLGIAIGYVSSNLTMNAEVNKILLMIFLGLLILYVPLLIIRISYTNSFPVKLAEELQSERELKECKENARRQEQIGIFFIESMKNLNGGTCALNHLDTSLNLCHKGINDGVKELIADLVDNIGFVLNSVNTKSYTVGFYLSQYCKLEQHTTNITQWEVISEEGIFILEDGLNKASVLSNDIVSNSSLQNEELLIHSAFLKSYNNKQFINDKYEIKNKEYSIICSPIPYACDESDALGILFVIANKLDIIPTDTDNNLKIFNRIIANWIYRYNECVIKRHEALTV